MLPFGPSVEKFDSSQCFLQDHPRILNRSSWTKDIPMIIGGCSHEGLLFRKSELYIIFQILDILQYFLFVPKCQT